MLFLKGVDNWKIYTVIQQPEHQRTEMLYQAWLGGLDRPYVRPKCMAHQPVWLIKKRYMLKKSRLDGAETDLEKFVLEWEQKFHSFQGQQRPTPEDLHAALDLVQRPLDLSYALQLLGQCRNHFNIRFAEDTFVIFLEACLRVGRRDCAEYALQQREPLGFWHIDDNCQRYLKGEQTWYKRSPLDNLYYPLEENAELNAKQSPQTTTTTTDTPPERDVAKSDEKATGEAAAAAAAGAGVEAGVTAGTSASSSEEDDELARLEAELKALEAEEARLEAESKREE